MSKIKFLREVKGVKPLSKEFVLGHNGLEGRPSGKKERPVKKKGRKRVGDNRMKEVKDFEERNKRAVGEMRRQVERVKGEGMVKGKGLGREIVLA